MNSNSLSPTEMEFQWGCPLLTDRSCKL